MWETAGTGLLGLAAAGFLFALVSYFRDVRSKEKEGPGLWATILDQSWITSSVVLAAGLSLREGLEFPIAIAVFGIAVVVGVLLKLPMRKFIR